MAYRRNALSQSCPPGDDETDDSGVPGRHERMWNLPNQITGEHACLSLDSGRKVSRQPVKVGSSTGRLPWAKPLREETADHACQDIAGAGRRHSWIPGRTHGGQPIRPGNHRARPFEDHKDASFASKTRGRAETILIDGLRGRFGFEPGHFSGMGSDDGRPFALGQE